MPPRRGSGIMPGAMVELVWPAEAIADATFGMDILREIGISLDFGPEFPHTYPQRRLIPLLAEAPGFAEERPGRDDVVLILHQHEKDPCLNGRKLDALVAKCRDALPEVDRQSLVDDDTLAGMESAVVGAGQQAADPFSELRIAKGFAHIIVGMLFDRLNDRFFVG